MSDYYQIAADIIQDGNLNKLNSLLSQPISNELGQTLRRIFQYLLKQKMFTISYGSEWSEWYPQNYKHAQQQSQIDSFLNLKWSVFLRLLFQHNYYDELILCLDADENSPAYRRLVVTSFSKQIDIPCDATYFNIAASISMGFDEFIGLIRKLPEIEAKESFSRFIQVNFRIINENLHNNLQFTKIINSHIVDKVDNPLFLANFLQSNFEGMNIELKINSLQSLLILMTRHQYNLSNFYDRLVELINNPETLECESRSKFMKLVDIATKSSKVSQEMLIRVITAVLRQCLKQSCALQLWAISLTFNIFKRHQTLKKYLLSSQIQLYELGSYQNHWYIEIRKIVSYLQDDLDKFDYFMLNDLIELTDEQLMEAQFEM